MHMDVEGGGIVRVPGGHDLCHVSNIMLKVVFSFTRLRVVKMRQRMFSIAFSTCPRLHTIYFYRWLYYNYRVVQ